MPINVAIYLGHSHTGAIFHAFDQRRIDGHTGPVSHHAYNIWASDLSTPYVVEQEGRRMLNPVVVEETAAYQQGADEVTFVSLFGGNAHNVIGLIQTSPDYDVMLSSGLSGKDRPVMPLAMVEARIRAESAAFLEQMQVLRDHTTGRVLHLQSPPPIENQDYLEKTLDDHFRKQCNKPVISRAELRWALWQVHSRIIQAHCATLSITFIPCPPEAMTSHGFLRQPFWGNATHANGAYGELLLQQVEQACVAPR